MALLEDINIEVPVLYELGEILQEYDASIKMSPSGDFTNAFALMYHEDCLDIFHSHISSEKLKYSSIFCTEGNEPWRALLREFKEFIDKNEIIISGFCDTMKITKGYDHQTDPLMMIKGVDRRLEVTGKDFLSL